MSSSKESVVQKCIKNAKDIIKIVATQAATQVAIETAERMSKAAIDKMLGNGKK